MHPAKSMDYHRFRRPRASYVGGWYRRKVWHQENHGRVVSAG